MYCLAANLSPLEFRLRSHWSLFQRFELIIHEFNIGSDNGLAPTRRQVIIFTNDGSFTDAQMRHSASIPLREHMDDSLNPLILTDIAWIRLNIMPVFTKYCIYPVDASTAAEQIISSLNSPTVLTVTGPYR